MNSLLAEHIADHVDSDRLWLPAVYSEDDETLRGIIVAELGKPVPSGYMSEECGWKLDMDDIEAAKQECGDYWWKDL